MTALYRLMGIVARLNERMSHTSVNLIPINIGVMVLIGMGLGVSAVETRDAVVNGTQPRQTSIAEMLAHKDVEHNYVSVRGLLFPDAGLRATEGTKDAGTWVPMVDVEGKRALFVQLENGAQFGGEPGPATVTGMLIPMQDELRKHLQESGGMFEGVPVDTEYMLVQGKRPGSAMLWGLASLVLGLTLALFVVTFLSGYVVFRRGAASTGTPVAPADLASGLDLRVTGRFGLNGQQWKRFLDVRAGVGRLETGELALVSNIDASTRFMGVKTMDRTGIWAVIMRPDSFKDPEMGTLYVGMAVRPALRIRYQDASRNRSERAILSFSTESERLALIDMINQAAGYSVVRS